MKKQVIRNDEHKLNIVILIDKENDIKVKGIAKCHEEDEYNPELGATLANTKAWLKYYEKLELKQETEVAYAEEITQLWQEHLEKVKSNLERTKTKNKEIEAEYEKIIETL